MQAIHPRIGLMALLAMLGLVEPTHGAEPANELATIEMPMPRLSPRPVMVAGVQTPLISLNGIWKFNPAPPPDFEKMGAAQTKDWSNIEVPGEWVMQGFAVPTNRAAVYWREFDVPADWHDQRIKLRFDTVHSDCQVFVNGRNVGVHEGCFTTFELDITAAVQPGRNVLALSVKSESTADVLASATRYAAHQLGGITRKVQLFALPRMNIAAQFLATTFDKKFRSAKLHIHLDVANESSGDGDAIVNFKLIDPDGKILPMDPARLPMVLMPAAAQQHAIRAGQTLASNLSIPVQTPRKWDPEHPNLYTLETEVQQGGSPVETLRQRFGFRQIEVRGNQLFVNNVPVKLRGACRHEVHPTRGRSLTPELWRQDAELFRAANVNYIRTSHYPPAEEFLDLCDEYGFFVECEAPLCWCGLNYGGTTIWSQWNADDRKFFATLLRANLENLVANRNHPCVTIWSLANESKWTPLFAEVNRRVKLADPTRPTSFHDQCWGRENNARSTADIAVYHYPDESGPAACDKEDRPVLFGEYCHVECYNRRELATDPGVRDDWGRGFARMYGLMYRHQGCLGGAIWAGIDEVFCLPTGKHVGYGMWGCVCDGWRRDKPETWHVKKTYAPVRVLALDIRAAVDGSLHIPVENRFNFTDLREVPITWHCGAQQGRTSLSLPPRSRGELVIQPPQPLTGPLQLSFADPRGFVCNEEEIAIHPSPIRPAAQPVNACDVVWDIDSTTGQLKTGSIKGRTILVGSPAFMLLPLQSEACAPVDLGVWKPLNNLAGTNVSGSVTLLPSGNVLRIKYDFISKIAVNPRQWGLVLHLIRTCDTLMWRRAAQWSLYPPGHIGRPEGIAHAQAAMDVPPYPAREPGHPWPADPTVLGGNDFASTKAFVHEASLKDRDGYGLRVVSDGHQAVRAFVDGDRIGLLVTGFHTGGGDTFFNPHFAQERQPIRAGTHLSDEVRVELVTP